MTIELPTQKNLYELYVQDFAQVKHLFEYDPSKFPVQERMDYLAGNWAGDRSALAEVLYKENQRLGAGSLTLENISALAKEKTVAVVTGQQTGLFTGPLLTVYKALTAIYLAQELKGKYQIKAVPVFWTAAEDHDYAEINHIHYLNAQEKIAQIKLSFKPTGTPSVGSIPAGDFCREAIAQLAANTSFGNFKEEFISLLQEKLQESATIADWFGKIMLSLLAEYGLIYFNPMQPELRALAKPFWKAALANQEQIQLSLEESEHAVGQLGFKPAVQKSPFHTHLFTYDQGNRLPLLKEKGQFKAENKFWTSKDLEQMMESRPDAFSPDVLLRPILQDYLLPTLIYVAGPGEINYWAQIKGAFKIMGAQMPILYPRASFTIIEPEVAAKLDKYHVTDLQDLWSDFRETKEKNLAARDNLKIKEHFQLLKKELAHDLGTATAPYLEKYEDLAELQAKNLHRIMGEIDYLESKVWQRHSQENRDLDQNFLWLQKNLYPNRHVQENIFNILPYLFKWGPELIKNLLVEHNPIGDFSHKFIFLGS
ncbi:bacillithiol biosynthesis cysteine-adding enzyme BshC [Bacillota bacterium LX-D]|nr:bacillithiol biosynthesis cysteine-adding enzyme BshC [Bacillota bacterium LX-D]